jgi:arginase family enzyme
MQNITEIFARVDERARQFPARVERRSEALLKPGVPTFAELPRATADDVSGADAVIYGIPFEGFVVRDPRTFYPQGTAPPPGHDIYSRPGAFEAPDAIRQASKFFSFDHANGLMPERGIVVGEHLTAVDAGDAAIGQQTPEQLMAWLPEEIRKISSTGAVPLVIGGDHLIPVPILAGIFAATGKKVGVVTYDAHYDLSWYPRYWAGSQWARAMEMGALDPKNLVHVGVRGFRNSAFWQFAADELGTSVYTIADVEDIGVAEVSARARDQALDGADALYVSVDVDIFDPMAVPAQKYPEPGGLTSREMIRSLRTVLTGTAGQLAGFDFCCLGPHYDHQHHGAAVAARCFMEVLSAMAQHRSQSQGAGPAGA